VAFSATWDDLSAFLLALVRASAWIAVCPPFNSPAFNTRVKIGLAAAIALLLVPSVRDVAAPADDLWAFAGAALYQVFVGLALGFSVYLVFIAVQVAAEILDLQAGFSAAQIFDPFTQAAATPIGRFTQLLAVAVLFTINGHVVLVRAFIESFRTAPLAGPALGDLGRLLTTDLVGLLATALEIAAPILATLFLTEMVLGLLTRVSPQMNVMVLGFIAKTLLVFVLVALAMPVLPNIVENLVVDAVRGIVRLTPGG
jgi:flagellar biosynthetic protein FliR